MSIKVDVSDPTQIAYDRFAPAYDHWNAQNNYEMWLGETLLPELEKHGLRKGWALDVGCGTGRAFEPLLGRGWKVVGCDVSAGMLSQARDKFGSRVPLFQADARSLPLVEPSTEFPAGGFSLVLFLNGIVNYFVDEQELEKAFAGIGRNLDRDQGLFVFDANTLRLFHDDYLSGVVEEIENLEWRGLTDDLEPGGLFKARLSGPGIESHTHRQRHWQPERIETALEASGLRTLAVLGQREEDDYVHLAAPPDEQRDNKIVYIAGPAVTAPARGAA